MTEPAITPELVAKYKLGKSQRDLIIQPSVDDPSLPGEERLRRVSIQTNHQP